VKALGGGETPGWSPGRKSDVVLDPLICLNFDPDCLLIILLAANVFPQEVTVRVFPGPLVEDAIMRVIRCQCCDHKPGAHACSIGQAIDSGGVNTPETLTDAPAKKRGCSHEARKLVPFLSQRR
jgi:hypothetical protein